MKTKCNFKTNDNFISSIRGLYLMMNFLGIWPLRYFHYWYNLIWYVQLTGCVFCVFGPIAGLIVRRHDTTKVIHSLGLLILLTTICFKWVTFGTHQKTAKELFGAMEEDWSNLDKKDLTNQRVPVSGRIMALQSRFARIFLNAYVVTSILGIINILHNAWEARHSQNNFTDPYKVLPIPNTWYPVDGNRSFNIQILTVAQTITATTSAMANISIDCIFVAATLHLCGQFEILRHFIEGITCDSSKPAEYCATKVRLMVQRHQVLLNFCCSSLVESLQKLYSFIILEQLAGTTLSICFLGYTIIAEIEKIHTNTTILLHAGLVFGAAIQGIFCYCFVGNLLTDQGSAIGMAVYNTQWCNCTRSINLSFLLVMERAGRRLEITGAKLLPMSLESFMVLMKAAASYFSVLRAIGIGEGEG